MLPYLFFSLLLLSAGAYYLGRKRAFAVAGGQIRNLHSLPSFYGSYTALWCLLPALVVLALWMTFQQGIIVDLVVAGLPPELRDLPPDRLNLVVNDLKNLISGNFVSSTPDPAMLEAANRYRNLQVIGNAVALGRGADPRHRSASPMPGGRFHRRCAPATGWNGSSTCS